MHVLCIVIKWIVKDKTASSFNSMALPHRIERNTKYSKLI